MAVYTDCLNLILFYKKKSNHINMDSYNLRKKIYSLCEIKGEHVSACELRSYNYKELYIIYNKLLSISSITNKNNSFYRTRTIY